MNNDVKDLMLAKKEKINEWLEYLDNEEDDVIWIQKNRAFSTGLYNIIYQLLKNESNNFLKKQEELVNSIGQYINNRDRLKVKEIVNKLKKLDDGEKINDDIDFNNLDQIISNIDNKLEQLKQEELEGKTSEEQEFSNITNSITNSFKESKTNDVIQENLNGNVGNILISKSEYEILKKIEKETLKIQRRDFALIINSGAILPVLHPDYNNNRVKIEIIDINNQNIEIAGTKYTIKTQILFNKIRTYVDKNLDLLIDWSKKETNHFLDNNAYNDGKSSNIKIKYGQLLVNINGQVSGELGKNVEDFINNIKELIIRESNFNDKDYIISSLNENNEIENNNSYLDDNDKIVNLLVDKIEKLENGKQFSILELINLNGIVNSKDIDLIKISIDTLKKLDEKGIEIKSTNTGVVGLPQGITYIKVGTKGNIIEIPN